MNVFNRVVLVLLLLALAAGAVAVIVLAWSASDDTLADLRSAIDWLEDNDGDFEKAVLTAVGAAVVLFCLVLIGFELAPRYGPDVKVTDLNIGDAVLSSAAISQRVEEGVRQVPHVTDVKASVKARRKGVDVFLDLHVDPDANLAVVTDAACEAARDVLTQRVHVALAHPPRARLHYRELRINRSEPPAPPPALPAPAEPSPPEATELEADIAAATAPEPIDDTTNQDPETETKSE